jgi:HK97 family phage major capsid protein
MNKQIAELQQRAQVLIAERKEMQQRIASEGRHFSSEEIKQDDDRKSELAAIKDHLDRAIETQEEERALVAQSESILSTLSPKPAVNGHAKPVVSSFSPMNEFSSFGEFLQGVAAQDSRIRGTFGTKGEVLMRKMDRYQAAVSGMSVGVPSDGGFLVRKQWTDEFLRRARESAVLLPRCRRIGIGADSDGLEYPYIDETSRADGSRWGGVRVYWKAEGGTVAASQPKLGRGEIRLEELMGLAYATGRLLRDAPALQGILEDAFSSEFAFKVDDGIIRGTGAGQMLGILSAPNKIEVAAEGGQTADTVNLANIQNMYVRMSPRLLPGAVWLINMAIWIQLFNLKDANDNPVYMRDGNVSGAPFGTLLGLPVLPIEQASAIGDVGDIMLVNLGEYVYIEKDNEGLMFDESMHVRFIFDEMAFRWIYRINGQPIGKAPVTQFKGSNTTAPFITLGAR